MSGTITAAGHIKSTAPTGGGVGYATGAGSAATQQTNKATTVVLNAICGAITMNNAALNAGILVQFTLTNSNIAAADMVLVIHSSAGSAGSYDVQANTVAAGSCVISVRNVTAGNLSEAIVLTFAIIKAVAA
jgi:hypothetical protein